MAMTTHECQIYLKLGRLASLRARLEALYEEFAFVRDELRLETTNAPDVKQEERETADEISAIDDVWGYLLSTIDRSIEQLRAEDDSRRQWVDAVDSFVGGDQPRLHTELVFHVVSGAWTSAFCKSVLDDLEAFSNVESILKKSAPLVAGREEPPVTRSRPSSDSLEPVGA